MNAVTTQQGVVLVLASIMPLVALLLLCLCCQRKPQVIKEENQIYDPQLFEGREHMTVVRSKTVTRHNRIERKLPPSPPQEDFMETLQNTEAAGAIEVQGPYQNVEALGEGCEPMYVDPIGGSPYQNLPQDGKEKDTDTYSYENVFPTIELQHDSDASDYENSDFLTNMATEKDSGEEADYVNSLSVMS
ncbi:uncharacterized protein LOC136718056 isoform X3 [Amia ocellicauda]|uniref:uncharacterized protein LOC136718056 isoform X3 n=1 Tax=Amia ocellicauda TaxID=2972642 RepID=UPI003464A5A6